VNFFGKNFVIKMALNALDLFCGCGGLTKGLVDAGINVIAGIDIWNKAIESYGKNFGHLAICEDLTKYPPERFQKEHGGEDKNIDIIAGSPPCQSFSLAGRRKIDDDRNFLFEELVKYVNFLNQKQS
jgi:DNA (cytosine-5)-methyltransferase 1